MVLLPFWSRLGEVHQLESYPESFEDWVRGGGDLSEDRQRLHNAVEAILEKTITRTRCRARDMNTTLEATLDDGTSVMIRQRHKYVSEPIFERWSFTKFRAEVQLLPWLLENTKIPLPSVIAIDPSSSDFSIQEKMPGSTIGVQWHPLSGPAKDHFMSGYVDVVLELFRLPVPQRIGSALVETVNGARIIIVGPRIAPNPTYSSPEVFENVFEYIQFLVASKHEAIKQMKLEDQQRAEEALSSLEAKAISILRLSDPSLLRCVLTHADLHNHNILANGDGNITAVIDWEINYIQPAILGVDYPLWLSDQGVHDPRFACDNYWWEEGPAERQRLCAHFEATVRERDPQFYKCLIEGRDVRAIVGWLTDTAEDPGFGRMQSWATTQLR